MKRRYGFMPRGVRKSQLEKLQNEIIEVQQAIQQYKNCIETLKEKEKSLREKITIEETKEVTKLLNEKGMTVSELKSLLCESSQQTA